jgi:DNA-binding transcriptional LysR family regulator
LTPQGEEIVEASRLVLYDLNKVLAVARAHSGRTDPLVIATTPTLEPLFDRHFLVGYHLRHPGSTARVWRVGGRDEVSAAVLGGEAMVGFSDLPVSDELAVVPLGEFEIFLLSPPGSSQPELMPVQDLDGLPMILPSAGSKRRAEFEAFFELFDVRPNVALESDERDCWLEGVLAGIGSVLWYGERVTYAVERGAHVTRLNPALRRSIGLSHRREQPRGDVSDLVELAQDIGMPSWAETPLLARQSLVDS